MLTSGPTPGPGAPGSSGAEAHRPKPRRLPAELLVRVVIVLAALVVVVVLATQWNLWGRIPQRQVTDDAYVRGDITPLSAKVDGYIHQRRGRRLPGREGRRSSGRDRARGLSRACGAGVCRFAAAEAAVGNLKARKDLQHAQIDERKAPSPRPQADVDRTKQELARAAQPARHLLRHGTEGRAGGRRAEALRGDPGEEIRRSSKASGGRWRCSTRRRSSCGPMRKPSSAALELARIALGYTWNTAPVDGLVSERGVRDGQYVQVGTQVLSVVPLGNVWVVANYKETQLTHVAIGQKAEVTVDTFPNVVVHGTVAGISPASQPAAARQRDRQLHQSGAAACGEDRARSRQPAGRQAAAGHVRHRDRHHRCGFRQAVTRAA